jgi:hypothetical protein
MVTRRRSGITFIEVVVVCGITAVLIGLLLPAVLKIRSHAAAAQCADKMRHMGMALHALNNAFEVLPPLCVWNSDFHVASEPPAMFPYATLTHPMGNQSRAPIERSGPFHNVYGATIHYFMLPFLTEEALYTQWFPYPRQTIPPGPTGYFAGVTLDYVEIKEYVCPGDPSPSVTDGRSIIPNGGANIWAGGSYASNYLVFGDPPNGSTEGAAIIPDTFNHGLASTIVFGERYINCLTENQLYYPSVANLWNDCNPSWRPQFCNPFGYNISNNLMTPVIPGYRTTYPDGHTVGCPIFQDRPNWQGPCGSGIGPVGVGADDPLHNWSMLQNPHPAGMNATIADGSVRKISPSISQAAWDALCDPH